MQGEGPGNVKMVLRLQAADQAGALCAAVIADAHAELGQRLQVSGGKDVLRQLIVGAVLVAQHIPYQCEQPPLETAGGEGQHKVDQVAASPLGRALNIPEKPPDSHFYRNSVDILFHFKAPGQMDGLASVYKGHCPLYTGAILIIAANGGKGK